MMKEKKCLVVGTDARLKILAKKLARDVETVYYKNVSSWNKELNDTVIKYQPDVIVLPIQPLPIEVPYVLGIHNAIIFAGKLNNQWKQILQNHEVHYYLQDEEFIWKNAALTAEAFISTFYSTKQAIKGKKFIITGFGRVAKILAHHLKSIGGNVCIAVRSNIQVNEAKAFGYEAIYLDEVGSIDGYIFINTIPAQWFDESFHKKLSMFVYDLASYPGCLVDGVTRKHYELLPALPGKFFPEDAGIVLYESIVGLLRRRNACSKENA